MHSGSQKQCNLRCWLWRSYMDKQAVRFNADRFGDSWLYVSIVIGLQHGNRTLMLSTLSISSANRPINVDLYTKKFAVCKKTDREQSWLDEMSGTLTPRWIHWCICRYHSLFRWPTELNAQARLPNITITKTTPQQLEMQRQQRRSDAEVCI